MFYNTRFAYGFVLATSIASVAASCVKTSFSGSSKPPVAQGQKTDLPPAVPPAETDAGKTTPPASSVPSAPSGPAAAQSWWTPIGTILGQTVNTGAKPPVVTHKDPKLPDAIHLQALRRTYDAWWKTCIFVQVSIDGYTSSRIPLGCNKDVSPPKYIDIPAKKGTCNLLWFTAETTKNDSGSCGTKACTYDHAPDHSFSSVGIGYQKFMMFSGESAQDVMKYPGFNRLIHLTSAQRTELGAVVSEAQSAKALQQNWTRVYFEDQLFESVRAYANAGDWSAAAVQNSGVDFNDFVLDLVGDPGIPFKFTGQQNQVVENFYAGEKPSQYAARASFCN
jgi:hypothetical protein